jgi:macrolide transport system ATP-binding/permease protein
MLTDLRLGVRTLARNPGFACAAILSIGLAIGANAAIFSLADGLVLRPLPVPRPSQVFTVSSRVAQGRFTPFSDLSYPEYQDFRTANRSFESVTAFHPVTVGFAKDAVGQAQLRTSLAVSGNFFDAMRVTPQLGRAFSRVEGQVSGRDALVLLSHDAWMTDFGGHASVVGRHVRLNGRQFEIIGVLPESFYGMDLHFRPSLFFPVTMERALGLSAVDPLTDREQRPYVVKGRLRAGVSRAAANSEAEAIFRGLQASHPASNRNVNGAVRTELQTRLDDDPLTPNIMALLGLLTVIVLVIACGNVANLISSRATARVREAAVRLAMGAGRWRLVRSLMAETVVLASLGGAVGVAVAVAAVRVFPTVDTPGDMPVTTIVEVDQRVLWLTLAVAMASALLCGVGPALLAARTDVIAALKTVASGNRRLWGRKALVSIQIAGSLILLIAGTQLSRGLSSALDADRGYQVESRITMRMDPALAGYDAARTVQFYRTLLDRAKTVDRVRTATLSSWIPMADGWRSQPFEPDGFQLPPGQDSATVLYNVVDDGFFSTLGVPILTGRAFLPTDRADSPPVAVVNQEFARRYLGDRPLGKRITLEALGGRPVEIVGVAATGKNTSVLEPPLGFMYLPFTQHPQSRMTLTAYVAGDAAVMAGPLRDVIRAIDPDVPVYGVRTLRDVFEQRSVKIVNLIRSILAFVGALGLTLALLGLYALVAYQVSRRTREIGIRMAIGAAQPQVLLMVLKQAAVMAAVGIAIGLTVGLALAPALTIIGNRPAYDSVLFTLAPVAMLVITMLAAGIPARRASRIDPQLALRQD